MIHELFVLILSRRCLIFRHSIDYSKNVVSLLTKWNLLLTPQTFCLGGFEERSSKGDVKRLHLHRAYKHSDVNFRDQHSFKFISSWAEPCRIRFSLTFNNNLNPIIVEHRTARSLIQFSWMRQSFFVHFFIFTIRHSIFLFPHKEKIVSIPFTRRLV